MSKIEWTEVTWNPVTGCTKISAGCKNCYAERMANRLKGRFGYPEDEPFSVTLHPDKLDLPYHWRKPRMIFVCSMGDLFHEDVPFEFIHKVFDSMFNNQQHTFQILTKRPERMHEYFQTNKNIPNVWLGVTAENQKQADRRIQEILQINAKVRFVSIEPMLESIDLKAIYNPEDMYCLWCGYMGQEPYETETWDEEDFPICPKCGEWNAGGFTSFNTVDGWDTGWFPFPKLDWVICGGESGHNARPMRPDWVRSIRDQCEEAEVPFFFKQWGGPNKKKAGRLLDGKLHDQYPEKL